MSSVDYCNGLLVNAQEKVIKKLQYIQNAAARLLSNTPKFKPIADTIKKYHWLSVKNRIKFKALCIAYKATHKQGPRFLIDHFKFHAPNRSLRSMNNLTMTVPRTRTVAWGDRSFYVSTAKLWNSLDPDIRSAPTLTVFRKKIKTWLFNQ